MPGIAALSTRQAVALARFAEQAGCRGLMVLPPHVHVGDERETRAHFDAVLRATALPCMLYNDPVAYGIDVQPARIAALAAEHANLVAVKESSGDALYAQLLPLLRMDTVPRFVQLIELMRNHVGMGSERVRPPRLPLPDPAREQALAVIVAASRGLT